MAARGLLTPLPASMGDFVAENYGAGQSWVDLGTFADADGNDQLFGFFYNVNVKSLVWFVPENFEDAGYEVPTTMEELQCVDRGDRGRRRNTVVHWSGFRCGDRLASDRLGRRHDAAHTEPAVYDAWTTNEIPFDDPRVVAAIEEFGWFARDDDKVAGGAGAVASTDFRDSPKGLFSSPPQCYMHRQASFVPAFFPEGIEFGEDADFFYFPAYASKDLGNPVLGGWHTDGDHRSVGCANALMEFLQAADRHEI